MLQTTIRSRARRHFWPRRGAFLFPWFKFNRSVREIVFFNGGLQRRNGVLVFVEAVKRLVQRQRWKPSASLTIIGDAPEDQAVKHALWDLSQVIPFSSRAFATEAEAVHYLTQDHGRVTVMPSLDANFPAPVALCLAAGVPFLASRVGGIVEHIHADAIETVTFSPVDPESLASKIAEYFERGAPVTLPPPRANGGPLALYEDLHSRLRDGAAPKRDQLRRKADGSNDDDDDLPHISVVMVSFNQDVFLREAIESLQMQEYPTEKLEVILVDSGSTNVETNATIAAMHPVFRDRGWRVLYTDASRHNPGIAAANTARNMGAGAARGEFILFMDDDNLALPYEMKHLGAGAVRSGADIITTSLEFCFEHECKDHLKRLVSNPDELPRHGRMLFAGGAAGGPCSNRMGDTNMIVKKTSFDRIGGFTDSKTIKSYADWELLLRASLHEMKVETVPVPLFLKRDRSTNISRKDMNDSRDFDDKVCENVRPHLLHSIALPRTHMHVPVGLRKSIAYLTLSLTRAHGHTCDQSVIFNMLSERLPAPFVDVLRMGCQVDMRD